MPVIINEFEIITETPRPDQPATAPAPPPEQPPPLRPDEIARILQRQTHRLERIRAD